MAEVREDNLYKSMDMKRWSKNGLTIILVGEAGSGKTAFISYLANMCFGRKITEFRDEFKANGGKGDVSESVGENETQSPTFYIIKCAAAKNSEQPYPTLPQVVGILDAPSDGIREDKTHKKQLVKKIEENRHTIDAVVIVANGKLARLGMATSNALQSIRAVFPNTLIQNVGFMLTHCKKSSANFDMSSLPNEFQGAEHWHLENPLAHWNEYCQYLQASGKTFEDLDQDDYNDAVILEARKNAINAYDDGLRTLNSFFKWLDECALQPTYSIHDLYEKVNQINSEIANIMNGLAAAEQKREEIKVVQNRIAHSNQTILNTKDYDELFHQYIWRQIDTPSEHNTLCAISGCHSNCHIKCQREFTLDSHSLGDHCYAFRSQWEMSLGAGAICDICKHTASEHHHFHVKWERQRETLPGYEAAKKRFESAVSDKEKNSALKSQLQEQLDAIDVAVGKMQKALEKLCEEYNEVGVAQDYGSYLQTAIKLFEQRYRNRKAAAANKEELNMLTTLISSLKKRYEIVTLKSL